MLSERILEQLPALEFEAEAIEASLVLSRGFESVSGETCLVLAQGRLWLFERGSTLEPFEAVDIDAAQSPQLEAGHLGLESPARGALRLEVPLLQREELAAFLDTLTAAQDAIEATDAKAAVGPPEVGPPEVGTPEAGTPEAGTPEAGTPEAGTSEAGTSEAGTPEAGTPEAQEPAKMVFSENVEILERDGKTYYIIGTAHISQKSVEEVQQVIDAVKPDTVCVELCETRYRALTDDQVWKKLDIFEVIKQGKMLYLLAHLALSSFQKRMGEQLGVKPGAELMAAVEKAQEHDAHLVLADRDVQITLKRTWRGLTFFDRMQVFAGLMGSLFVQEEITEEELEKIKEKGQLTEMMKEFSEAFPSVKGPLIDERDSYLISSIEEAPGEVIVAVVGAGHVEGMVEKFGSSIDRETLNVVPERSRLSRFLPWLIPIVVIALFFVGGTKSANAGADLGEMLRAWILPNSIFCALMTMAAGGKFPSILVGFVASPITSLNPAVGAGMAVGLTEAWLRKPTVADLENVRDDVKTVRGAYQNPFTRVLLVAVFANIGSALGAYVGLAWLFKSFFA